MYSISNVIVGVPITSQLAELVDGWEADNDPRWREWEDLGFETFYHGGAPYTMGFCGVKIGEFDECQEYIRVHLNARRLICDGGLHVSLDPTDAQVAEAMDKVNALDPELGKLCPEFGTYIVQSTS
jgi:hypothetical protein